MFSQLQLSLHPDGKQILCDFTEFQSPTCTVTADGKSAIWEGEVTIKSDAQIDYYWEKTWCSKKDYDSLVDIVREKDLIKLGFTRKWRDMRWLRGI